MKNKTFLQSIACAFRGLAYALKTEKNYKYYTGIAGFFLIVNLILRVPVWGHLYFLATAVGVFACECLNTAIEHICNRINENFDLGIRVIKDVAAASIFCMGFAFFVGEAVLIVGALI